MYNALAQGYTLSRETVNDAVEPHIPVIYEQSAADPYFMPRMWVLTARVVAQGSSIVVKQSTTRKPQHSLNRRFI
jgi:hypothetical protein